MNPYSTPWATKAGATVAGLRRPAWTAAAEQDLPMPDNDRPDTRSGAGHWSPRGSSGYPAMTDKLIAPPTLTEVAELIDLKRSTAIRNVGGEPSSVRWGLAAQLLCARMR